MFLDLGAWLAITKGVGLIRLDAFSTTPSQFLFLNLIELVVVGQALYIIGGYDRKVDQRSLGYTAEHILAIGAATAFSSMLIYSAATFDHSMKPSRSVLLLSFLIFLPISLLYRRGVSARVVATFANETFLVIGSGEAAVRFYNSYKRSPNRQQLHFVDVAEDRVGSPIAGEGSPIVEGDLVAKLENLNQSCRGVILAERLNLLGTELLERLVRTQFQQMRVYTLEAFYETQWRYVPLDVIDPVWPLQTGFQLARTLPYHHLKRLFDLLVATAALVICAPLLALLAILIWLESGRPILFSQERMAREGEPFTMFKFRTMGAPKKDEIEDIYTRARDPRVTRLGRWLRQLHLDELPQLVNVLKGEMSLIGPRAEWIRCAERYEKAIPFYHFRHLVKPGITGWAQVSYGYGASDEDAIEKLQYDLYYLRHYSLKLDAMIVLKTIHVMLFGKGR